MEEGEAPRARPARWSIGIAVGRDPLCLTAPAGVENPVLTASEVRDLDARFVADPFLFRAADGWHMFFEVMPARDRRGRVGHATSRDGLRWAYDRIVLQERFHLSYPFVFEHAGQHFLLPETLALGAAVLYRADPFPVRWVRHATLARGPWADPTLVRWQDRWWLFGCPRPGAHDTLALWHADSLEGPWVPHPSSPVVRRDRRTARPAGRAIVDGPRLIRLAQDCQPRYGTCVRGFEVLRLDPDVYEEREIGGGPILGPDGFGRRLERAHHLDVQRAAGSGGWLACFDGEERGCES